MFSTRGWHKHSDAFRGAHAAFSVWYSELLFVAIILEAITYVELQSVSDVKTVSDTIATENFTIFIFENWQKN